MSLRDSVKQGALAALETAMTSVAKLAPDEWLPGGTPDPLMHDRGGLIGAPIERLDGPLKVSGRAEFAAEHRVDNMLYAAIAFGTIAKGRIASLDVAAAENALGVRLVMTYQNAPRMQPMPIFLTGAKAGGGTGVPPMQDDQLHWNGQPIAIVLADTQEMADHATALIAATYEEEPATTSLDEAIRVGTEPGKMLGHPMALEIGDAEEALAWSFASVDNVYSTPRQNHNAIEPHAATLWWSGEDLVVHDATQAVSHTAWSLAQVFGLREEQVRVVSPFVGGGFGGKSLWFHQVLAAAAAKLADRPVRIALSREGVYRLVGGRTQTRQRLAIGADLGGKFTSIIHTGVVSMTRHNAVVEPFTRPSRVSYAAEAFKLGVDVTHMDMLANSFMRAPGEAVGSFALESGVDELAEMLGVDPIELRLRNQPEKDPAEGTAFSSRNSMEAWTAGADRFGWHRRNPVSGATRDGEWMVGVGCAGATYPYNRMPGGAARITLTADGRAHVEVAGHEMGVGTQTVQTQACAARLGLPISKVSLEYGDSMLPGVVLAAGSQQTASISAAVMAVHRDLVAKLIKAAGKDSALAGLSVGDIICSGEGLESATDPCRRESYVSILAGAGLAKLEVEASAPSPLEAMHWSIHSYGAIFVEVRVSAWTGEIRINRCLGSFDCGRILNPRTAEGQFRGGMVMGIGLALMEETLFDERTGRIIGADLANYHVPVHADIPNIDVMWTDIPDPRTPLGARGIGEIGITGTAAAIANAVYNACGKRVRDLPLTLDKIL